MLCVIPSTPFSTQETGCFVLFWFCGGGGGRGIEQKRERKDSFFRSVEIQYASLRISRLYWSMDVLVCPSVRAGLESRFSQVLSWVQGSAEMHKERVRACLQEKAK